MIRLKILALCALLAFVWGGVKVGERVAQFCAARQQAIVFRQQANQQKNAVNSKHFHLSKGKEELLNSILIEAQLQDLFVANAFVEKNQTNSLQIDLNLQGNFSRFLDFIQALVKKKITLQIDAMDVTTHQSVETIKIKMTLLLLQMEQMKMLSHPLLAVDPFAQTQFANLLLEDKNNSKKISLNEVRYAGYLQMADTKIAILQLPNGVAYDVNLHESFGAENAIVTEIDDASVIFQVNGHEKIKSLG